MASITFRFITECELTLEGASYEEIYLQFKDFQHDVKARKVATNALVYPPESDQIFFKLDKESNFVEIPFFKGDYKRDMMQH